MDQWMAKHPEPTLASLAPSGTQIYDASAQNAHLDHHRNFYASIRDSKPLIEDGTFGLRAAGPALLTNESYFSKKIVMWDPAAMKVVSNT